MSNFIRLREDDLNEVLRLLNRVPKLVPRALYRSLNRAISSAKTEGSRAVRDIYTIKVKYFNQDVKIVKATSKRLEATFKATSISQSIPLSHFQFSPHKDTTGANRQKVKVTIKKGNPFTVSQGFVWNNNVFMRKGSSRLPIVKKTGPTVAQMLNSENILEKIKAKAEETLKKRVLHEVNRILEGHK